MHKVKVLPSSLKAYIADELMVKKIISYKELKEIAKEYGTKESVAERRLRNDAQDLWSLPVKKLNSKMKPLKPGEPVAYYKWVGSKTFFKKIKKEMSLV